jgi:hypothetical protein
MEPTGQTIVWPRTPSISAPCACKFARNPLPKGAMRFANGSMPRPVSGMAAKVRVGAAVALCSTLALGACSPFSGYVADNWPHWAGGEPAGVPPRPGSPGYSDFISHGQAPPTPNTAVGTQQPAADQTAQIATPKPAAEVQRTSIFGGPQVAASRPSVSPSVQPNSQPSAQSPPASGGAGDDGSVLRGGLY